VAFSCKCAVNSPGFDTLHRGIRKRGDPVSDLEQFRQETRAWLEENCPASMREPVTSFEGIYSGGRNPEVEHPDQVIWCERMAERGWTVPHWPKEYGGGGLDSAEVKVLREEMSRISARRALDSFGISMLGPALLHFGNEEQKLEHLPKICRGEIRWCQGYSEPNAGSDLASLATKADDQGDHYIINGSTKHEGISFVLFDMDQPGVTVKPIKLISGSSPFCETFFDDARADKKNLVGEEGNGWTIAKYLLTHEREMISGFGTAKAPKSVGQMAVEAMGTDSSGRLSNSALRQNIAQYQLDTMAFGATMARVGDEAKAGQGLGAASSIFKYYGTELNKRRNELNLAALGEFALGWEGEEYRDGLVSRDWLRSKGNSIEGGTTEVQLNIVAKRVLGLPDA
jgi:alkylation response protein AidB-like acyl-CoA dehydrogenase